MTGVQQVLSLFRAGERLSPREEAVAWRTITRAYFGLVACYFTVALVMRFVSESGTDLIIMTALTATTALLAAGAWYLTRHTESLVKLESVSLVVNLSMLVNPVTYMSLHFEAPRVVFFLYLGVLYALSGVSLRVLVPSLLACGASLITLIPFMIHRISAPIACWS